MRRLLPVALAATAAFLLAATAAWGMPLNRHTDTFPVVCDGETVEVTVNARSNGAAAWIDGQVAVALGFAGAFDGTLTVAGETSDLDFEFADPSRGQGLEGRLIECTFTETFEETFEVTRRDVRELGLDPALVGETAMVAGTFTGTAWVMVPGQ